MKHYDYKDETKDVRGKVNYLNPSLPPYNRIFIDRET